MGTWVEPEWIWKPGWELEWEPEWEAGWEPEWEPEWALLGGSLGAPWRVLGGSLEGSLGDQTGTQGWSGTGPAPGTQKVPKVCNCRHKQARGQTNRHAAVPDFGYPQGTL